MTPSAATRHRQASGDQTIQAREALRSSFKGLMASVRRLRGRETQRPGELSFAHYSLLFGFAHEDAPLSSRQIAEGADLSPATVTQMLETLEACGLVVRVRSAQDRRVVLTELTGAGREAISARRATLEPRFQAALSDFSAAELRTAAAVLDRLAAYHDSCCGT
ncbi:MAG: MarR family winged helix-turn-helix transcriptional regulator [Solirubrobacteraceae bacterium]